MAIRPDETGKLSALESAFVDFEDAKLEAAASRVHGREVITYQSHQYLPREEVAKALAERYRAQGWDVEFRPLSATTASKPYIFTLKKAEIDF